MRLISIISVLVLLVGCGNSTEIGFAPDRQIELNRLIGVANSDRIELLELRLNIVENDIIYNESENLVRAYNVKLSLDEIDRLISLNSDLIAQLQFTQNQLDINVAAFPSQIFALNEQLKNEIEIEFDLKLEDIINQLDVLNDRFDQDESFVSIVYPCGVNNSQEILINTDFGVIAYFEESNNAYLSVIPDGNYRTTDGYQCNFSILNGQVVE